MPTITFTAQQFEALKNILKQFEWEEYKWVQENHEDCEAESDDTPEKVVARLEENGAGNCTYAHIQHVWVALKRSLGGPKIMTRETWEAEFGPFYKQTLPHRTLDDLYEDYVKSWDDPEAEDS
jgi:hypothetical protein